MHPLAAYHDDADGVRRKTSPQALAEARAGRVSEEGKNHCNVTWDFTVWIAGPLRISEPNCPAVAVHNDRHVPRLKRRAGVRIEGQQPHDGRHVQGARHAA